MHSNLERYREHILDAMAGVLVQLHLAGFFWGDCSLSNTLFRKDAGTLQAYIVDVETAEFTHPPANPLQRLEELKIMELNVNRGLENLQLNNLAKDVRALGTRAAPAGSEATSSLPFEVRRAMERAPVVLYTAPDCQPCAPAAALLRERGVPYAERTITTPDDLQEFRRISGAVRLPHLTVGSQAQNGFNADLWMSLLDAAGYPKGSMLPRSYQWPAPQPLVPPPAKSEARPAEPAAAAPAAAPEPARR